MSTKEGSEEKERISLVVQWFRLHVLMQGARAHTLVAGCMGSHLGCRVHELTPWLQGAWVHTLVAGCTGSHLGGGGKIPHVDSAVRNRQAKAGRNGNSVDFTE